jgi:hypothetical protein
VWHVGSGHALETITRKILATPSCGWRRPATLAASLARQDKIASHDPWPVAGVYRLEASEPGSMMERQAGARGTWACGCSWPVKSTGGGLVGCRRWVAWSAGHDMHDAGLKETRHMGFNSFAHLKAQSKPKQSVLQPGPGGPTQTLSRRGNTANQSASSVAYAGRSLSPLNSPHRRVRRTRTPGSDQNARRRPCPPRSRRSPRRRGPPPRSSASA